MDEQLIRARLQYYNFTPAAIAGIMGNWRAESNLCSYRLQSDHSVGYAVSLEYTAAVDAGEKDTIFWQDGRGYGLAQWTSKGRKLNLLNFAKAAGVSIGDPTMQVDWFWKELHDGNYPILLNTLLTTTSVAQAASDMCTVYERPYVCDVQNRTAYANAYFKQFEEEDAKNVSVPATSEDAATSTTNPIEETTEPVIIIGPVVAVEGPDPLATIAFGATGEAVKSMQRLLIGRRYYCGLCGADGDFGNGTKSALNKFQTAMGLEVKDECDKEVWTRLILGEI